MYLFFKAENGNIVYIPTDYGHKNSGGDGIIKLEGRETDIVNIFVTKIGENICSRNPLIFNRFETSYFWNLIS